MFHESCFLGVYMIDNDMKLFSLEEFGQMQEEFRVNFINSLSGFESSNLIGTFDGEGNPNLGVTSACFHLGADPALIGLAISPIHVEPQTIKNLIEQDFFTINHVDKSQYKNKEKEHLYFTHDFSDVNPNAFTEFYTGTSPAPYAAEALIKIGLKKKEVIPITETKSYILVGLIQEVLLDETLLGTDGRINAEQVESHLRKK